MPEWKLSGTSIVGMGLVKLTIGKHDQKGRKCRRLWFRSPRMTSKDSLASALATSSVFEAVATKVRAGVCDTTGDVGWWDKDCALLLSFLLLI